jgi:hypothetical protein
MFRITPRLAAASRGAVLGRPAVERAARTR